MGLSSAARARMLTLRRCPYDAATHCRMPIVSIWLSWRKTSSVEKFGTNGPQAQRFERRGREVSPSAVGGEWSAISI